MRVILDEIVNVLSLSTYRNTSNSMLINSSATDMRRPSVQLASAVLFRSAIPVCSNLSCTRIKPVEPLLTHRLTPVSSGMNLFDCSMFENNPGTFYSSFSLCRYAVSQWYVSLR